VRKGTKAWPSIQSRVLCMGIFVAEKNELDLLVSKMNGGTDPAANEKRRVTKTSQGNPEIGKIDRRR